MLAQAVVQILTDPALFTVTDGEDFAFQSTGTIFQDRLSFFLVADVENNRDGRSSFAFGVAQWRRTEANPQSRPFFASITFFELIRLGFIDESVKKSLALGHVTGICDLKNSFADEFTLFLANHLAEFLVRENNATR